MVTPRPAAMSASSGPSGGMLVSHMTTARPRDAATLILLRRDGPRPRILLGCRSGGHDFMPEKWVFPGGRIDRADYRAQPITPLRAEVADALAASSRHARQNGPRLAQALAQAAVRETFEEAGLILGMIENGRLRADLACLRFIARAITPPARHRRYDTRFLLADAEALQGLEPADSRELRHVGWFTLDEARRLDLPTVTRAVLELIERHALGQPVPAPFWRWTRSDPASAI